ncbi:5,10-methylenetetrahydrofolate reductase [Catellatospora sp. KI3]|uniref:methylenetetrahydrofolate reductase n=1 Tax=Catellatospora sp. KI3 TaxID=3041620 RepID=UPI002482A6B8|nr:5,10-methylenetetrahydrofolate reductase [Catellatospora sp. KI3]MDI1466419.1 5,10-methylenetetrahydrofolate reductase [Catellatospora sp. KI3]
MLEQTVTSPDAADPRAARPPLRELLTGARSGALLFGITPPRRSATPDEVRQIAAVTMARLAPLDVDGLVLYDIDDESDRNPDQRPFPYLPTMDPGRFRDEYLTGWDRPVVVYRCVGKYPEADLRSWLDRADPARVLSVFVGASSSQKTVRTSLPQAQVLHREVRPELLLGGVAITERYVRSGDEHLRLAAKQARGCAFFISQVVYDVDATKSLVSDYFHTCREQGVQPRPILFTLSVCGSLKTLAFLKWLGVGIPRWLENALTHAADPLAESYDHCLAAARELSAFCRRLEMPYGFNVESVSIRKVEIEASVALAVQVRALLDGAEG